MGFLLFLSGSVGVSPQGEPGVEVSQHGGDSLYVHTVLQRRGSKGVTEIVESKVFQSSVL